MKEIQIRSVLDPFDEVESEVVRDAVDLIILAHTMGLLPETETVDRLDMATVRRVARAIAEAGIGPGPTAALAARRLDPEDLRIAVRSLREALEGSPHPQSEWRSLLGVFGVEDLAKLTSISPASLRRYASGRRPTPDDVAGRVHLLAKVVADLRGAYNDIGVRRWFGRKRTLLGGKAPAQVLRGEWDPEGTGAGKVRDLARSLTSSPAT